MYEPENSDRYYDAPDTIDYVTGCNAEVVNVRHEIVEEKGGTTTSAFVKSFLRPNTDCHLLKILIRSCCIDYADCR